MKKGTYAIDFESYYDKDYSLSDLSYSQYVTHPKFDPYLIAVWGPDIQFVGPPDEFKEWDKLDGADWIMHNAHFDATVMERCKVLGIIPNISAANIYDTADLAAYLRVPRDLANAARVLLGVEHSKGMRNYMKGRTWSQAIAEGKAPALKEYGIMDAKLTYEIWDKFGDQWPELERRVSIENREAGFKGINIDAPRVDAAVRHLNGLLFELEKDIPWEWDKAGGKTPLARTAVIQQCRDAGIEVPSSFAKDSEECAVWEEKYADTYSWIKALRDWRSINMLLKKMQTLQSDIRSDGTFGYSSRYFGAHTGRMSGAGDAKYNIQNLPKKPMHGVDVRAMIIPRPGKTMVLMDYAQIEARALLWVVGDKKFIELLEREGNLYQADAKYSGLYSGSDLKKDDPDMYNHSKAKRLSLGFGCGHAKYQRVAKLTYGVDMSLEQAKADVVRFRAENPRIVALWRELQNLAMIAASRKEDLTITLPSGRSLVYYKPIMTKDGLKAMFTKDDPKSYRKIYGGLLTENLIQALCRDIMAAGWISLVDAGMPPLFTVHDEFVNEFDSDKVPTEQELRPLVLNVAPWAKGCPLDIEYKVVPHYLK